MGLNRAVWGFAATDDAQEALKLIGGLNQTARSVRQCLAPPAREPAIASSA